MSIRLLAKDLYRVLREVETLEQQIADAPQSDRPALEARLRAARAEMKQLKDALDGSKA
jgi:hypothetical protein